MNVDQWKQQIEEYYGKGTKKSRNAKAVIDIKQMSLKDFDR